MATFKANISAPTNDGALSDKERIAKLERELYELYEMLCYVLSNIDSDNFTEAGLAELRAFFGGDANEAVNA